MYAYHNPSKERVIDEKYKRYCPSNVNRNIDILHSYFEEEEIPNSGKVLLALVDGLKINYCCC